MGKFGPSWPKHGPHLVLKIGSSWNLKNVPKDVPFQISHCWVYPKAHFPKNSHNMTLLWQKHGPNMILHIGSSWNLIDEPMTAPCQFSQFRVYSIFPFSWKWPKYGPFIAKTWSSHGPSIWFFLNINQCAQGCSLPNFTLLGVSCSPLS